MPETLILPDLETMDQAALKAMIRAQQAHSKARPEQYTATLNSRASEIAHLKLLLDKLQRMLFGAKSEKLVRQVAQLELQLEELETTRAEAEFVAPLPFEQPTTEEPKRPSRRSLPEHLPREVKTHPPEASCCPGCGGTLREFGEDVSELLEYVPESFKPGSPRTGLRPWGGRLFAMCDPSSAASGVRRWSKSLRPRQGGVGWVVLRKAFLGRIPVQVSVGVMHGNGVVAH